MAKTTVTPAAKADAKKRNMRTPEQRIADLEAQLNKVKDREAKRADKGRMELIERSSKLSDRIDKLVAQRDAVDAAIAELTETGTEGQLSLPIDD